MISIRWRGFNRVGCVFTLIGAVFMVLAFVLLTMAVGRIVQEQGYQVGQCTITAKQLQHEISTTSSTTSSGSKSTTSSDVYAPFFEFTVRTADGRTYRASGYDGSDSYMSDRARQQAIVDSYRVGRQYQCWYNPANPTQAILVRHPDWVLIFIGGGLLLFGALFAAIGILALCGLLGFARRSWRYSWRG